MEAILYIELLGLLYKSTYDFNMNTYICNDCLSLFNIALIVIEKKRNVKSTNYIMSGQFPIMKKHEHLIGKNG